jgi:predicted amidohydrolase YtcJ
MCPSSGIFSTICRGVDTFYPVIPSLAVPSRPTTVLVGSIHRYPGDPAPARAVGIRDGRIVALGSVREVRQALGARAATIDLRRRSVLPSFVDSHTHLHRAAMVRYLHLDFASLRPRTIADVLASVRARAETTPSGSWIQGDSLAPSALAEGRLPNRWELDAVAADRPVVLRGIGKHVVAANSLALRIAGIDADTADPPGGRIERDSAGEPTGILHERAKLRLDSSHSATVVPSPAEAERLAALRRAIEELHRLGVTTVHEMVRLPEEAADFERLRRDGSLHLRVRFFYRLHETPVSLDWFATLGLRGGFGDQWVRILGVKISVDGFCIFGNAAVDEPYLGQPANRGILRIEPDVLSALVKRAVGLDLTVAVHAVGGRALDLTLAAFEAAAPFAPARHRIEHAYLDVTEQQLQRIRDRGLVWSVQPAFRTVFRDDWQRLLGPARAAYAMPIALGHRLGVPVIFNSDVPTGPVGPLGAIAAAVAGGDDGMPSMSPAEAWFAHSVRAAEVAGEPGGGRLVIGAPADLVVVEGDPLRADWRSGAESVIIVATMVDGEFVYIRNGVLP